MDCNLLTTVINIIVYLPFNAMAGSQYPVRIDQDSSADVAEFDGLKGYLPRPFTFIRLRTSNNIFGRMNSTGVWGKEWNWEECY